jgi:transcriptional regulator with XRE-family HTH domain
VKTHKRDRARLLRQRDGRSIKHIARVLGVSKSSVSLWVRDIEMTPEQHAALLKRNGMHERQRLARAANIQKWRSIRRGCQADGRRRARSGDAMYAAGCMLYWAEGSKQGHQVQISNADEEVIRFFVWFLRRYFLVPDHKIRLSCNLFADHESRQREIEDFWLSVARLDRRSLRKSMVNRYSRYSKKKRKNRLPYGTCRLSVGDVRILQTIYGSIQEYGGFDRPEWLG